MVSIYLTDRGLKVASARNEHNKTVITGTYTEFFLDDCISGGSVFDRDIFKSAVVSLKEKGYLNDKRIALVLDTPQLITKAITLASEKESKTYDFVKKEFYDVEDTVEKTYAYSIIFDDREKKLKRVLATMVDRKYIDDFLEIFKESGVRITDVYDSLSAINMLLKQVKVPDTSNNIIQIYENNAIQNILLVNGNYFYSGRTSIFGQNGTEMFAANGARDVSNIMQFAKAKNAESGVSDIYISCVSDIDFDILVERIQGFDSHLEVHRLSDYLSGGVAECDRAAFEQYIIPIAVTAFEDTTSNINHYLKRYAKKHSVTEGRLRAMIPFLGTAAAMFLAVVIVSSMAIAKSVEVNSLTKYVSSEKIATLQKKIEKVAQDMAIYAPRSAALSSIGDVLYSYPIYNETIQNTIKSCVYDGISVDIIAFDANTGQLEFNTRVVALNEITPFIASLKATGLFKNVDYTGYDFDEQQGNWKINMVCMMEKSAGRMSASDDKNVNAAENNTADGDTLKGADSGED